MKTARANPPPGESGEIPEDLRRDAWRRIVDSAEFSDSPRLCAFLSYVVQEQLAGRSRAIKGKTIAVDVYGRNFGEGSAGHNIVRVEARRLRRLLDEYYAASGRNDPIRLYIDAGGYVPRFTQHEQTGARQDKAAHPDHAGAQPPENRRHWPGNSRLWVGLAALCFAGAGLLGFVALNRPAPKTAEARAPTPATRAALREHSVQTLQAADIAAQARAFYFPVFDARRQKIALDMFAYAIDLEPGLSDGYAGSAQVLATLHMITPDAEQSAAYQAEAERNIDHALAMAPSDAWVIAAQSWVLAQAGQRDDALRKARMALSLAPNDGHILDLVGMTGIHANDPALSAEVSNPRRARQGVRPSGTQNIWGVSNLILGNNAETIAAFADAPLDGAVVSAPSLIFQAIAHDRVGDLADARRLVRELNRTWPDFPTQYLIGRVFANNPALRREILERLDDLTDRP